jgi:xanthine dehydrogenase YagS FAD-binding subunit
MAAALLAYDATVVTDRRSGLSIGDLLGDGSNGKADHLLLSGEMIQSIALNPPLGGERAAYKRAISRSHAEWPLVEVCARATVSDGLFQFVCIAAGGIAPVPLRLLGSEAALLGKPATAATIADAARQAAAGATPLPMTGYKLDLLSGLVRDLLEGLAGKVLQGGARCVGRISRRRNPPFQATAAIIVVRRNHRSFRHRQPNLPEIIRRVRRDETRSTANRPRA